MALRDELFGEQGLSLHTIEEVADLFPMEDARKKKEHVAAVEALAIQHGTYRMFGNARLMTKHDVADLIAAIGAPNAARANPASTAPGFMLIIGPAPMASIDADVCVTWAPINRVQATVDSLSVHADHSVQCLAYVPCTWGEFQRHQTTIRPHRQYGRWYQQTAAFKTWAASVVPPPPDEHEE